MSAMVSRVKRSQTFWVSVFGLGFDVDRFVVYDRARDDRQVGPDYRTKATAVRFRCQLHWRAS
jgi:hypothetical protein